MAYGAISLACYTIPMGTEIKQTHFAAEAWSLFSARLAQETALLEACYRSGKCSRHPPVGGFEIEAWLLDKRMRPVGENVSFLKRFDSDLATYELATFNFELNNTPLPLQGSVFGRFREEMLSLSRHATAVAEEMGIRLLNIGILPTLKQPDLCIANMSPMKRYHALNEQVLRERDGRDIILDIASDKAHLTLSHSSMMMESATTSFQIHTQVPFDKAHHYYNASILASAATVALSANAPLLFGKQLWHETRIPLFEQSVDTGEGFKRVSFGSGFARESIMECFTENLEKYDILLPIQFDSEAEKLEHLQLHNGTIWRWNRPLVGFDEDGTAHFRIEHRVMPSGPTLVDMLANAAFYYGLEIKLAEACEAGEFACNFDTAEENFYTAAREGLESRVRWQGEHLPVRQLILEQLLPLAKEGLEILDIDSSESATYLSVIGERAQTGQNGAAWQLAYLARYGEDMERLAHAYWQHQQEGNPVHTWEIA